MINTYKLTNTRGYRTQLHDVLILKPISPDYHDMIGILPFVIINVKLSVMIKYSCDTLETLLRI